MESRELIDHQKVFTLNRVTRDEAIQFLIKSNLKNFSAVLRRYLSIFDSKNYSVFIGKQCAEIHVNKHPLSEDAASKLRFASGIFIQILASATVKFNLTSSYDGEKNVMRIEFKGEVETQEIINFILRLRFLNFVKSCLDYQGSNEKIFSWMKEGYNDVVRSIEKNLLEQAGDKSLARIKINNYFLKKIRYENIPSDLNLENSTDVQQDDDDFVKLEMQNSNLMDEKDQKRHNLLFIRKKAFTREKAKDYLKKLIKSEKSKDRKKNSDSMLNKFLELFQPEKHKLTIAETYAEIRVGVTSRTEMHKCLIGSKAFVGLFVLEADNIDFEVSCDGETLLMWFNFKNNANPQEINNIINRINFVGFAKNILDYNSRRIHELFSLMIKHESIVDELINKIKTKYPNDPFIQNRVNDYFPKPINNENISSDVTQKESTANIQDQNQVNSDAGNDFMHPLDYYSNTSVEIASSNYDSYDELEGEILKRKFTLEQDQSEYGGSTDVVLEESVSSIQSVDEAGECDVPLITSDDLSGVDQAIIEQWRMQVEKINHDSPGSIEAYTNEEIDFFIKKFDGSTLPEDPATVGEEQQALYNAFALPNSALQGYYKLNYFSQDRSSQDSSFAPQPLENDNKKRRKYYAS